MRVSRAEPGFAAAFLIFAALFAPLHPASAQGSAQNSGPVPLLRPTVSPAPTGTVLAPPDQAPGPTNDGDIQSEPLAPIDPSWIGTLGAADRALPHDMWSTTPRGFIDTVLPLLQPTTSPVLQDLARRLLLSDAAAPRGQDPVDGPGLTDRRVDRLLALGISDGATLLASLPQGTTSEGFDRDSVELRIANGDLAGACGVVTDRVGRYRNAWWDRALVACQALTGAYDQAGLGLSALRDQKTTRDPTFEALIDNILGHRQKFERLPDPTPLRMTLLAAAKLPMPADTLANAGPAALAVWATSDKVAVTARLAAAEKAEALGALPPAGLGLIYSTVEAKPEEQGVLLKSGKLGDDPRSRAILYNLARTSEPGAMRIAALAPLVADARRRGAFVPLARLVAPLVVELQPTPDAQSFAGDAARVLLAARYFDRAGPWIELAGRSELHVIAGFARVGGAADSEAPPLADAIAALTALDPQAAVRQGDLLVTLAAALSEPVSGVNVANLLRSSHQGTLPNGALWLDQQQAAKAHRVGETVLTTLLLATSGDRLSAEPIVLAQAITGLQAVGLDADARALAVEAALDAGI